MRVGPGCGMVRKSWLAPAGGMPILGGMPSDYFPTSAAIRQIIPLAERRESLLKKIAELDEKIAALNATRSEPPAREEARPPRQATVRRTVEKTEVLDGKDDTTARILKLLKAAGSKGISTKEIASRLGLKVQNVHVWFSFKGSKLSSLQKVGQARWTLGA